MNPGERHLIQKTLVTWGRANRRAFPWRRRLPLWQGLLAEILLQRTTASRAAPVFVALKRAFPTQRDFARATAAELAPLLASLGLRKRLNAISALQDALAAGPLPRSASELALMRGIGPYSAGAALTFHTGAREPLVDANFARVYSRIAGQPIPRIPQRSPWLQDFAEWITPHHEVADFGYAVLDLAASICVAGVPSCQRCPIIRWCATGRLARCEVVPQSRVRPSSPAAPLRAHRRRNGLVSG